MSHSQFYCISFILRHAWLNLWDKHMTTGRINQVISKTPRRDKIEKLPLVQCILTVSLFQKTADKSRRDFGERFFFLSLTSCPSRWRVDVPLTKSTIHTHTLNCMLLSIAFGQSWFHPLGMRTCIICSQNAYSQHSVLHWCPTAPSCLSQAAGEQQ